MASKFCDNLTPVWGVLAAGARVNLSYRFEVLMSILTAPLALVIYAALWSSVYAYAGVAVIKGFTLQELIDYYVLSMVVGFVTWSQTDRYVEKSVRRGSLSKELVRPMSLLGQYLWFEVGMNAVGVLVQIVPIVLLGMFWFGLGVASPLSIVFFAISLGLAFLLYFEITFITGLCAFWLRNIHGIRRVRRVLVGFLSGSFLPLTFFPDWFQKLSGVLPFAYIRFVPINIYLGKYSSGELAVSIVMQLFWVILLLCCVNMVLRRALRKYAMGA